MYGTLGRMTPKAGKRDELIALEAERQKVSAELAHGVLTLRIPKAEHAQPRRIQVQVA